VISRGGAKYPVLAAAFALQAIHRRQSGNQ
jgi:hypothetical protein